MQVGTPRNFTPKTRKALLAILNELRRQERGRKPPLKSVRKIQHRLGKSADESYALIEDLQNATEYIMLRYYGADALRSIFNDFMGQNVIINCIGFNTKSRKDAYTIDDTTFDVYRQRYWLDSQDWYWTEHGGRIVVTTSNLLTPENIQQLYRQNETNTCVFDVLLNHLGTTKTAERTYKTIQKYKKIHPNGVNDDEMETLMNKMKMRVKIYMPFNEIPKEYGHEEKYVMMVNMLNVRRDHVVYGNNMLSNPVEYVETMPELEQNDFFNLKKTTIYKPEKTIKLDTRYRREQEVFFKQFKPLDNKNDFALSQFILGGTYQTGSFLFKTTKKTNHIDHIRSYSQFHRRMYKGFPQKFTDFRVTKELQGIGYYYVKSLDWTHANKKLKQFNQKCLMYVGNRIYPSVEIEMLQYYGVEVRIMYGAWGTVVDFEFTPEQHEKIDDVRIYSKMIGTMCHMTKNVEIYTYTQDPQWISYVGGTEYFGDLARFTIPLNSQNHYANIAGFIYGYQRINLIAQILEMDIEKLGRINVDGIYYEEHAFRLLDDFTVKEGKYPNASGDRLICEMEYDRKAVLRQVLTTTPRQHFITELFKGAGGTGKSYYNLHDKGLHRPLYVAVCRLQLQGKEIETSTMSALFNEKRWEYVNKNYDVMIVDECSMINEKEKNYLLKFKGKIIFIGDVDYQIEPVKDTRMSEIGFENVREMKTQYRCKCDKLQSILNDVRTCIDKKRYYYGWKASPLKEYKREDVILCHTHKTIEIVNKLIDLPVKYRITENGGGVFNGEIYLDKPKGKYAETHAFTVHTLQGQTASHNVWIHKEIFENTKLLYTALSRAKNLEQIKIF
jgi:hypothetical protein